MEELHVIVSRQGDQYIARVPGVLKTLTRADNLTELEKQLMVRLADTEDFKNASFTVVRKMVREPNHNIELEADDGPRWILWKQDKKGGRHQVSSHATALEANRAKEKMTDPESLYWVEPERVTAECDSGDIWDFED